MNTISLVEYYLLFPFFKKTENLNWPNRARTATKQASVTTLHVSVRAFLQK